MSLKRYSELKKQIHHHDYLYHLQDQPEISDYEYDQLYSELLTIEKNHPEYDRSDSPSQRVGGQILDSFVKVGHRQPMLSLSNSYSPEDILEFDLRVKKFLKLPADAEIEYFVEPKFDGLALELVYEKGLLVRAITRGDGQIGEDVTQNIKTISTIPLRLKNDFELFEARGEVLILKKDFERLNNEQQENGLATFANPRNAAAGTVRQLDSKIAAKRPLRFFGYGLGETLGVEFVTQDEVTQLFHQQGLPTTLDKNKDLTRVCKNALEVTEYYHWLDSKRKQLPFDIDGMVVKVNSIKLQGELGIIARSPRWATAAKFKPDQAQTIIENILVQVGRTGALTPVAVMKPVKVGGVTVTHATLHNQEEIDRKDLHIGDTVIIQRAGDVIPEVVSVVLEKRPKKSQRFVIPANCPSCGELSLQTEGEVIKRCVNVFCPAILKESLKHFVSRRAMNIEKLGDRWIEIFVEQKKVVCFSDLYQLKKDELLKMDRLGEKSVQNLLSNIEKSKHTTLAKFIYAQGIRFVGEQTAKLLAEHYLTVDQFLEADETSLMQVPEIGPKVAQSILMWLSNEKTIEDMKNLLRLGVMIQAPQRNLQGRLAGKSFLITGTLSVKREEAKALIEQNGGKILGGVSSKLNYLVVGDDPGSKLEKAQNLGVQILSWEDLTELLKE